MRRYLINKELLKTIKINKKSLRKINNELGFEVRNLLYKNFSISEEHLKKLESFFNKKFRLKKIYLDYGKNLGGNTFSQPIKKIKKNKDLAEFIGIMLGDGNIWKNRIRIAFDKRNETYIKHVSKLFENINKKF